VRVTKLPVNVSITGVDYSTEALSYYAEMLDEIRPWLASAGFKLSIETKVCDLAVIGNFSEVLDSFFDEAKQNNVKRFLCVISALYGAGKEGFEQMHDSLKFAAARLSHSKHSSSWLWVEPYSNKAWPMQFVETVRLVLKKTPFNFLRKADGYEIKTKVPLLPDVTSRKFDWHDPHALKTIKSHVVVREFRNE
jgi:hypothetical protein